MKKIKTNVHKRLKPKKQRLANKTIVIIKIVTACILLLGCSLFFFSNMPNFWKDVQNLNVFPLVFFAGLIWICVYIVNLAAKIDDKNLYLADRYDWLYKIVFIITVISMVFRSFVFANYYMPPLITTLCIISGIITLFTPKTLDNNNDEF